MRCARLQSASFNIHTHTPGRAVQVGTTALGAWLPFHLRRQPFHSEMEAIATVVLGLEPRQLNSTNARPNAKNSQQTDTCGTILEEDNHRKSSALIKVAWEFRWVENCICIALWRNVDIPKEMAVIIVNKRKNAVALGRCVIETEETRPRKKMRPWRYNWIRATAATADLCRLSGQLPFSSTWYIQDKS